jgi:hypothetical protein
VRAPLGRLDALDFELDPGALFQMMNASIESQKEFESVFGVRLFISCHSMIIKYFNCPVNGQLFDPGTLQPQPEVHT